MASSGREKMASWTTSKRKSSIAANEFSRGNRSRRERELEWEQKTTKKQVKICLNRLERGETPKVAVTHSGKTMHK